MVNKRLRSRPAAPDDLAPTCTPQPHRPTFQPAYNSQYRAHLLTPSTLSNRVLTCRPRTSSRYPRALPASAHRPPSGGSRARAYSARTEAEEGRLSRVRAYRRLQGGLSLGGRDGQGGRRDAAGGPGPRAVSADPRATLGAGPEAAVGTRSSSGGRGERAGLELAALELRAGALPARLHLQGGHALGPGPGCTWPGQRRGQRRPRCRATCVERLPAAQPSGKGAGLCSPWVESPQGAGPHPQ